MGSSNTFAALHGVTKSEPVIEPVSAKKGAKKGKGASGPSKRALWKAKRRVEGKPTKRVNTKKPKTKAPDAAAETVVASEPKPEVAEDAKDAKTEAKPKVKAPKKKKEPKPPVYDEEGNVITRRAAQRRKQQAKRRKAHPNRGGQGAGQWQGQYAEDEGGNNWQSGY
ncbi:hypothetical protein KIPB_009313 [Kipferlia bialata]|uniref:Uncharacterized protein n=1 Tax=Kipferlia bialata TaxID=797122 RepID=A0A9K3D1G8_9EUKA|nr:hypothetical protein KIPB_009313 [Kipferlia bialata]|eukprot:g9313.t1